eukprot:1939436-Prymnesium_polylepis.1
MANIKAATCGHRCKRIKVCGRVICTSAHCTLLPWRASECTGFIVLCLAIAAACRQRATRAVVRRRQRVIRWMVRVHATQSHAWAINLGVR